ncbi:MAG: UPF0182 family protein, partial [Actinomycetes bacterium]|nr:UPF0182 family protein [Actinomycetes bacterium]MDX5379722.1 UPF0182 family protein [Actinomycetes bacterium]MDX5398120.1 UPF0182 family protein [Actinomycetes bacterium]MDX5449419.1 UPF0182 family protein [Actinomycetes bacterium]
GTQVPLLHRVLVSFGDEIGFAPTLAESLDQVFGGDSGAETADEDVAGPGEEDDGVVRTAEEKLRDALDDAAAAMRDAEAALAEGNWTAYGLAQDRLDRALAAAIDAEAEISGQLPVDAEPTAPADEIDPAGAETATTDEG